MLESDNSRTPYEIMARLGRALSSPQRLRLLHLLAQSEYPVEELARTMEEPVGITSHHLRQLNAVQLATSRRVGRQVVYALAGDSVLNFWLLFRGFAETRLAELQLLRQLLAANRANMGTMDCHTLRRELKQGNMLLLDVRPRAEFEAGHIPGAVSMPLAELSQKARQIPKNKTVVLCCRGPYCLLAFKAWECLSKHGIRAVCLSEGSVEWAAAKLPLQREAPAQAPSSFSKRTKRIQQTK